MDSASPNQIASFADSRSELDAFTFTPTIKLAENFTFGENPSRPRALGLTSHPTFESAAPPTMGAERPHVPL